MLINMFLALALSQQAPPAAPGITAGQFSGALQGMIGQSFEGGVRIAGIHAEGNILVIVFDGPHNWRATPASAHFSDIFLGGFCQDRDFEYFVGGNLMRVDTVDGGVGLQQGPLIHACPASAAHRQ
jgi:hypothetical protein